MREYSSPKFVCEFGIMPELICTAGGPYTEH